MRSTKMKMAGKKNLRLQGIAKDSARIVQKPAVDHLVVSLRSTTCDVQPGSQIHSLAGA